MSSDNKEQYWRYSLVTIIVVAGLVLFFNLTPFLGGFLGAFTLYILTRRQMLFLTERKGLRRSFAALLLMAEVVLCFLIPITLAVWLVIAKILNANLDPDALLASAQQIADLVRAKTGYDLLDKENLVGALAFLPKLGQSLMGSISSFLVNLVVLIVVLYFMLIGGRPMERYVYDLLPFSNRNKAHVVKEVDQIVTSNAIGIPLLGIIQGLVALVGYLIFHTPDPLLLGFLTCLATVIPLVGTAIVWLPVVLYMTLTGDWPHALGLAIYALVILTNVDNLIRFILQKKMADIHPLVTIFGVVIGLSLFGFMGIIFGPLLLSLFLLCVNMFKKEYLDE